MERSHLEKLVKDSCTVVTETADFIRAQLGQVEEGAIETKALNSLVSYVDKEAERQLVEGLGKLLPEATFLTEEETVEQLPGTFRWIIDPLDGTTNFLHQLPFFSVSVALQEAGETIIGIVYEINRKECFYAWKEGGAYLNGQIIRASSNPSLSDALIATGFPYYDYSRIQPYFSVLEKMMRGSRGLRRLGSAALDLAYVACGRFDAYFEYSLNSWDIAAGAFLVQEAGGRATDFSRADGFLENGEVIASGNALYPVIAELVETAFRPVK